MTDTPGLYMVDCRFVDPEKEPQWNDWYDAHVRSLLENVPGFLASQRFRGAFGERNRYLAIHSLSSLEVVQGDAYRASRGGRWGGNWGNYITDWHRSFYTGAERGPEVPSGSLLVATDYPPEKVARLSLNFVWLKAAGLDPITAQRGLAVVSRKEGERLAERGDACIRLYEPMWPPLSKASVRSREQ